MVSMRVRKLSSSGIGSVLADTAIYTALGVLAVASVYPFLFILFASFSDPVELMKHRGFLFHPLGFTLRGYALVIRNPNIASGYKNTLIYVVLGTVVNITLTAMGAYALSRKSFIWKKPLMILVVFTMFFQGGLIPFYFVVRNVGLYDTRAAMILPTAIATWNLIILRTAFMQVPDSLEESARLDGANDAQILWNIVLPVSKATLAVLVLFYAVGHWNQWFNAMVLLRSRDKYPLQLILREILITNDTADMTSSFINPQEEDMYKDLVKYTTVVVSILPILLLYPYLQRFFVKGVMIGSLKG